MDRQKARRLGVSTGLIGNNLRTALYGKEISTFKDFRDDYPINIRLDQDEEIMEVEDVEVEEVIEDVEVPFASKAC